MIQKLSLARPLLVALGLVALSGCGALSSSAEPATNPTAAPIPPAPTAMLDRGEALHALEAVLGQVYIQVSPSVVMITADLPQAAPSDCELPGLPYRPRLQGPLTQNQQSIGSGFVWDMLGHIVTNWHVIAGCANIVVTFSDGTIAPASLVGADWDSDLAVVRVDVPSDLLHPVVLGDSSKLRAGQLVIAIGSPFGKQNTMTSGIISAVGRSLPARPGGSACSVETIPGVLQTDAALNPGSSGGVLVNHSGQLIGVPAAIDSPSGTSVGVGYAIPSALVRQVIPDLISTGYHPHPWLGIDGTSLTPDLAERLGLPHSQRGAFVTQVIAGSPAEAAGLRCCDGQRTAAGTLAQADGDVIVAIDGQAVSNFDSVLIYIAQSTKVGQTITLTLFRHGKRITLDVTLAGKPTILPPNE